jgi:hypothetical protein
MSGPRLKAVNRGVPGLGTPPPGPLGVYDMKGRPIGPGDLIGVLGQPMQEYEVTEIRPNLNPNAPPGTLLITATSRVQMMVPANTGLTGVLLIQQAPPPAEPDASGPTDSSAEPPAADTPSVKHPDPNPAVDDTPLPGPKLVTTD